MAQSVQGLSVEQAAEAPMLRRGVHRYWAVLTGKEDGEETPNVQRACLPTLSLSEIELELEPAILSTVRSCNTFEAVY